MTATKITIGRNDDNTLKVPEEFGKVSGYHGEITMDENGGLVFTDYSSNGTIINGQRVHNTSYQIYRGDEILLAGVCLVKWETINNFLPAPNQGRATVLLDQPTQGGRETVMMEQPQQESGGRKTVLKGMPTQDNQPKPCLYGAPPSNYVASQATILPPQPDVHQTRHPSSGKPSAADVSRATKKWNWGAFCLSFIWGYFHKIYWPLIVPIANLVVFLLPLFMDDDVEILGGVITWIVHLTIFVVATYLGINGSEQAWKLGVYKNLDDFKEKEKSWATAGFIFTGFQVITIAVLVVLFVLPE